MIFSVSFLLIMLFALYEQIIIFSFPTHGKGFPLFSVPTFGVGCPLFSVPIFGRGSPLRAHDGKFYLSHCTLLHLYNTIYTLCRKYSTPDFKIYLPFVEEYDILPLVLP